MLDLDRFAFLNLLQNRVMLLYLPIQQEIKFLVKRNALKKQQMVLLE